MSNISTIATYLARFSGQLQPMLEKVQGMDRRTFLLETAALFALTSVVVRVARREDPDSTPLRR